MSTIPFTQFLRPDGRQRPTSIEVSDDLHAIYQNVAALDLRMTVEELQNLEVSMCIEDRELGDFDCIVCSNGPEVPKALETMLRRFDALPDKVAAVAKWRAEMGGD